MNLKQLIKFGMEESQEPVIKNPILRQALEPRTMDLAEGGRIPFGKGKDFDKWLQEQIDAGNTTFETQGDLIKKGTGKDKAGGNESRILNKYKDKFTFKRKSRLGGDEALKNEKILEFFNKQEPGSRINVERAVKDINKTLPKDQQISETIIYNRLKDTKFNTNFLGSHTVGSTIMVNFQMV
jgi:hypothetical protein